MKLKHQLLILLALAGITACQLNKGQKGESELFHIDVPAAIETQKDIPLSEIAESITYIPLETNPKGLLGYITKIVTTNAAIYVSDRDKVLKFTPKGKFIRQIGNKGNGPGEHNSLYDFSVAEKLSTVFITDFGKKGIMKFDTAGNYQNSIETGVLSVNIEYFEPDKLIAYFTQLSSTGNESYIQLTDLEFNPIAKYKNRVLETGSWSIGIGPVYQYNKSFYYRQSFNDTVYQITPEKLNPCGIMAIGEYQFPKDFSIAIGGDPAEAEKALNVVKNKLAFNSIFESDKFMLIRLMAGIARTYENPPIILYNKVTKEATAANSYGFVNDINNGVPFIPKFRVNDNTYIDFIDAFDLKTKILEESTKTPTNDLLELANSLDENDNPILMLVKLKE